MTRRLLDLFSCAGGAAMGYARAGFEVVGVDLKPQPRYPFEFHQADAIEFLIEHGYYLDTFDVIHASPPCQSYLNLGAVNRALGRTYDHPDLVSVTRDLLIASGKPYVIENVEGAPLLGAVRVCGTLAPAAASAPSVRVECLARGRPVRSPAVHHPALLDRVAAER